MVKINRKHLLFIGKVDTTEEKYLGFSKLLKS